MEGRPSGGPFVARGRRGASPASRLRGWTRMHHRTETAMASSLSDLFNRIARRVQAELERWGPAPQVEHLFDPAAWLGPLLAAAGPQLERAGLLGALWERRGSLGRQRACN